MRTSSFILCVILCLYSCSIVDAPSKPRIRTAEIINIGPNTASSGGFEIHDNNSDVYQKGVCWDTIPNPEVTDIRHLYSDNGEGTENFETEMEWLQDETEYYVRAYAINHEGVSYGNERTFTTSTVELEIDCEPNANSISINYIDFNYVETGWGVPVRGEYGLEGHSLSMDFSIGFESPPRSGVYTNVGFNTPNEFLWIKECAITATNIGVVPGGSVYVERIGKDNYSLTFCDLNFELGISDFTASGNLTSN